MLEWVERRVERLRNWRNVAEVVCVVVKRFLPDASVYVFGSVARGDWSADSDIDVLIISGSVPEDEWERAKIAVAVKEALGSPAVVELHFATPEQYREWYAKFIDVFVEVC